MTTATAIDLDALNDLFENQSKLDDVFNSIFDDDSFLSSSISLNEQQSGSSTQEDSQDLNSNDDLLFYTDDESSFQRKKNLAHVVIPVAVEIAAITYGVMYLT